MTYLQLVQYGLNHFKSNENLSMLTKFTVSQYVKFVSDKAQVSNGILAENWDLEHIKVWNNKPKPIQNECDYNCRPNTYGPGSGKEFSIVSFSNFHNLGVSQVIKSYMGSYSFTYDTITTLDHAHNAGWHYSYTPWTTDGFAYNEDVNNRVETDKPITIYDTVNESDAVEYFVGKDASLNVLRQFIVELEQLHIEEHQKQLEENRYDRLPFKLNEILQENTHKLILKCEEHIKRQANQKKLNLTNPHNW